MRTVMRRTDCLNGKRKKQYIHKATHHQELAILTISILFHSTILMCKKSMRITNYWKKCSRKVRKYRKLAASRTKVRYQNLSTPEVNL
jgi:hypothetical protein